jgi:Zn finger protein HypA/HybF involved in hydrogenase expression
MMMVKKNYCNIAYCEGCGKVIPSETDVAVCNECSSSMVDVCNIWTSKSKQ